MNLFKTISITIFLFFSTLIGITYAETLKFAAATYEGEVKKGKAHGIGVFTFSDGSTYEGAVNKNKIHGKGKYTDSQGNVFEGKFKYGSLILKIDNQTRNVVKIKPKTGFETYTEIKGEGSVSTKWFKAEKNSSGEYELTDEGKRDMTAAMAAGSSSSSSSSGSGC